VCSPYFRTLLNSRPDKHPIVYLKDVNPKHLEQLLSYMYRGEINVLQEDLGPLIETARGLQIKGLADAGDNNSRKEPKTNQNGLPSHQQSLNQPKRSRTSTPTPAPKIARIEAARPAPLPTQVLSPPSHNSLIEDDDQPIVEVDPTENSQIKQEMWMMSGSGRDGEDSNEFEIPPEQYEQDMQAEDEQYIQAGNEGLTGQQFTQKTMHLNAIGNRNVSYNQESFVTAYYDVLIHGLTITKAAMKHQIPRKTLEYYVKGKATHDSYQKMGLPLPHELLQYEKPEQLSIETV